jgi:hypothetical protein
VATDEVVLTPAQIEAARLIVERNSANGQTTPDEIKEIANATARPKTVHGRVKIGKQKVTTSEPAGRDSEPPSEDI